MLLQGKKRLRMNLHYEENRIFNYCHLIFSNYMCYQSPYKNNLPYDEYFIYINVTVIVMNESNTII